MQHGQLRLQVPEPDAWIAVSVNASFPSSQVTQLWFRYNSRQVS